MVADGWHRLPQQETVANGWGQPPFWYWARVEAGEVRALIAHTGPEDTHEAFVAQFPELITESTPAEWMEEFRQLKGKTVLEVLEGGSSGAGVGVALLGAFAVITASALVKKKLQKSHLQVKQRQNDHVNCKEH